MRKTYFHRQVVGLARRVERIEKLAEKLKDKKGTLHGMKVDLTETQQIIDAFKKVEEKYGPISILVNNAGVFEDTTLIEGDVQKWKKVFDINVIGEKINVTPLFSDVIFIIFSILFYTKCSIFR